jgi:hypothetical protein
VRLIAEATQRIGDPGWQSGPDCARHQQPTNPYSASDRLGYLQVLQGLPVQSMHFEPMYVHGVEQEIRR